ASTEGDYLKHRLKELEAEFDVIGEVRGEGLMIGIEFVKSKACKEKNYELRDKIVDECFYEGLLILGCGQNSIRFSPPLVINREQSAKAIEIFRAAILKHI
ncbi:MAG: aminotransferase class III-fold pyridoxal phosphate-dependent enzyme, partial [Cyanobacteria bacterium]|nr:aminotransferase class III-fold pyridoxal phosphate-dependent enzyme [Cyanobacteriota bacterium]